MIGRLSALLLVLCGGCPSVEAPAVAAAGPWGFASIVRGSYVFVGEACSNPSAVFRYHGWNIGWIRRGSGPGGRYSIHRVREGPEEYVGTLFAPWPGAEGDPDPSEADISITAVGDGERIVVRTAERVVMRICPEDALPVWARERPVFMQYLPGKVPVALDAPSGGVLTQRAECLGVIGGDGRFATAVWPATARIEFDARGLVVVDGEGSGRVRLGDYVQFTGGPLPKGARYPLGDEVHVVGMPMACARWPGWNGWITIVNPGFRGGAARRSRATTAAGLLPIATGAYVEQVEACGNPGALFRYDGRSMGWTRGAVRPMYPIRRVREEPGQWVATIVAPGPGAAPVPRELDVVVVPRGGGRITVKAMERTDMKLCATGALPAVLR